MIKKHENLFTIFLKNVTYAMEISTDKILIQRYYGKRVKNIDHVADNNFLYANEASEYPVYGSSDFRTPAFHAKYSDGSTITKLTYKSYKIINGKPKLEGLPSTYVENDDEAETLIITLEDTWQNIEVELQYTAFENFDALTKSAKIINKSDKSVKILSALSCAVTFNEMDYDFLHLEGAWARERHIQKIPLINGNISIDSKRGASSHCHNPFFALMRHDATEDYGEVYGFNLIYSGNFIAGTETDAYSNARAYIGLNPFNLEWELKPQESFQTPEAVMVYSYKGLGEMSRTYHRLYRTRLARGKYRDTERPVLINNWEATYFDFNEEKILDIAKKAKEVGVELLVLDDGWFGKRDTDNCSLGDWVPDIRKLPDGISGLSEKINKIGLKFGLWFEPEMISPDSDLYRNHPDWCIHVNGRPRTESRRQLVLDMSREDVCEYIINAVEAVLKTSSVSYVKWDMNRNITEAGSELLTAENQQELMHRYMLGLYKVLDRITSDFPDILFESCASGGGRFDGGMLYYMPQVWTSDDTDAVERLYIQYGTSVVYPTSSMGAHVSAVPNHQVGRITDINMRGLVAMCGRFGYEMDLSKLTDEEIATVKEQIKMYHKLENVIHHGDMYRLKSPFEGNITSLEFISEDKKTVVVVIYNILHHVNKQTEIIRLNGLDENAEYKDTNTGKIYGGDYLMNVGLQRIFKRDFTAEMVVFVYK